MDEVPESTELERRLLSGWSEEGVHSGEDKLLPFSSSSPSLRPPANRSVHSGVELVLLLRLESLLVPLDLLSVSSELSELGLRHRK